MFVLLTLILPSILCAECTFQSNLISIDTDVSMDEIKDPIRPTFIRLVSPGCPYSPASQAQWEKAASLYPQVNFVTVNSWENHKITPLFGKTIITPLHGLFQANSATLIEDSVIENSVSIHNSPQLFLDTISKYTNLYQVAPPLVNLSPMIIDSFYSSVDDPIILLYNSKCTDQVPFLNEWSRVANEVIYSNGINPRIGMLDCSIYPDECQRWSHPYAYKTPRALIYSKKTGNYEVLDTYNTITSEKIDGLYANALSRLPKPTPTPVPIPEQDFKIPSTDGYTILENSELKDQKTLEKVSTEYKEAFVAPASACKNPEECKHNTLNSPSQCPRIEPSEEDQTKALKMINFLRGLAGLSKDVVKDDSWSEDCYQTAINMHKIGIVPSDHIIKDIYATKSYCGRKENIQVGKDSLLSENAQSVFQSSYKLIKDEGAHNNLDVGHRRYLLHPSLNKIGIGFYPYKEDLFDGYSMMRAAVTVIRITKDNSLPYLENSVPDNLKFISWPPEGPFPLDQLPSNWHISHKDFRTAKLEDLKIYVNRDDGAELKVKQASFPKTINDDSLVIQMTDEALKRCQVMRTITVNVFNEPLKKVYRFSFELFDGKEITNICLYSNDDSKCPDFVSNENRFGPDKYHESIFSSSDKLVKVHVVEPIKLNADQKISFTASTKFFLIGETIDGIVEIGSKTTVDVQNPSKTSYQINWNVYNKEIGKLETALTAKSVFVNIENENEEISIYDLTFYTGRQTSFGLSKSIFTGANNDIYYSLGGVNDNFFVMASKSPAYQEFSCTSDDEFADATYIGDIHNMIRQSTNKRVVKIYVTDVTKENPIDIRSFIPGRKRDYQFIVVGGHIYFSCDLNISNLANSITFSGREDKTVYNFEVFKSLYNQADERNVCPIDFITVNKANWQGDSAGTIIFPYIKGDDSSIAFNDPANFNDIYPKEGEADSNTINAINDGYGPKSRCIITTSGNYDNYRVNYDFTKPSKTYRPFIFRPKEGKEDVPITLSFYEIEYGKRPQGPTDFVFYFENYKDLTLDMPTVVEYRGGLKSYLGIYNFDNCGKVTFIGNDNTTPEKFEIDQSLTLGNINYGCIMISPLVMVTKSDSYNASWFHAKHLSVSPNLNPTITNITVKEAITIDSSTVIIEKSTLEKDITLTVKKTASWWPSLSLQESDFAPKSISIDLGIPASSSHLLDDSKEEYESHSLITGIGSGSGLKCEELRLKTTINNNGKFALECSDDGNELIVVKGKENAPVLSPEEEKNPTENVPVNPTEQSSDGNNQEPEITPGPDTSKPNEIIKELETSDKELTEESLNKLLIDTFNNMGADDEKTNKVIEIVGSTEIPFNSELNENEFIKPPPQSNVHFNGGSLNLVLPEKVTVTIKNEEKSNLTIKGSGSVTLDFKDKNEETQPKSIKLTTKSQINGSVTIIVPNKVSTFSIDKIEFDSKGSIEIKKLDDGDESKVRLNVGEISTLKNSKATLNDLKIEKSLEIAQSSVLTIENVDFNDASISYNIDDYSKIDKETPFINGQFKTLPGSFSLIDSKNKNNKPSEKVEYTIVSGTFIDTKCEDWYPKIILDNSAFNSKVCKEIQESKLLVSENKKIVVQYDPSIKKPDDGDGKNKLSGGQIAGIVIGVVAAVAIVVVVVIIVIRRKRNFVSSSDDEEVVNDPDLNDKV